MFSGRFSIHSMGTAQSPGEALSDHMGTAQDFQKEFV